VAQPGGVAVQVLSSAAAQNAAMRLGTRALVQYSVPIAARAATAGLSTADRLVLSQNPYGSLDGLVRDCQACAVDELVAAAGGPVRGPEDFTALLAQIRPQLAARTTDILRLVVPVLATAAHCVRALAGVTSADIADDARHQLSALIFTDFISELGADRVAQLPRYLGALQLRLESLPASADRDQDAMAVLDRVGTALAQATRTLSPARRESAAVLEVHWMIEELRVSLFAQQLGTRIPVSEKRIAKAIAALR
jgi:ATP-dependent helicase HrpA